MTIAELAPHVDRLNSWVRSPRARDWWNSPARAIYDFKLELIRRAIIAQECKTSAIYLSLTCRACDGTKRYTDSYGHEWPHCRKCSSLGVVRLTFLVTEICGFFWHSPWERVWSLPIAHEELSKSAALSTDWEPNHPGKDLEVWEVVESLNILEAELPGALGSHGVYCYGDFIGEKKHAKYKLYLGRSQRTTCELCGESAEEKDRHFYHVVHDHVDWAAWACPACADADKHSAEIFKRFAVPSEPLSHPSVRTWIERRKELVTA